VTTGLEGDINTNPGGLGVDSGHRPTREMMSIPFFIGRHRRRLTNKLYQGRLGLIFYPG
jgi:hypothetical protein